MSETKIGPFFLKDVKPPDGFDVNDLRTMRERLRGIAMPRNLIDVGEITLQAQWDPYTVHVSLERLQQALGRPLTADEIKGLDSGDLVLEFDEPTQ
jgi:hypothetical protein